MRILMIATLVSTSGAYGGPTTVALNQAAALQELGHDVLLTAGVAGFDQVPHRIDGVPVKLFPVRQVVPRAGFAGLASPKMMRWLRRTLPQVDVVHIHLARDLITMPAAKLAQRLGVPYVVQTHGMIDAPGRRGAEIFDRLLTVNVLNHARAVCYLTPRERRDLVGVAGEGLPLVEVSNGVPATTFNSQARRKEVLFVARLQARKRPQTFARSALALAAEFPDTAFAMVGPDEGEAQAVRQLIEGHPSIRYEGPIAPELVLQRMAEASVYVLPSIDEPFPMSVLEAMSLGLPVVITDSCGLASAVDESRSGIVVPPSQEALTAAIRWLLVNPEEAAAMGIRGREQTRRNMGIASVARRLLDIYSDGWLLRRPDTAASPAS